jgi:hypothetical protein
MIFGSSTRIQAASRSVTGTRRHDSLGERARRAAPPWISVTGFALSGMAALRLEARLRALPFDVLVSVAARAIGASASSIAAADALLASECPLPAWAVDSVLLATDHVPAIFSSLGREDCAVAVVCSSWRMHFQELLASKHILRWVEPVIPGLTGVTPECTICASASSSHIVFSSAGGVVNVWDCENQATRSVPSLGHHVRILAVSDHEVWVGVDRSDEAAARLCRLRLDDLELVAERHTSQWQDEIKTQMLDDIIDADEIDQFVSGALSPDGRTLFVTDWSEDEFDVLRVDAVTLDFLSYVNFGGYSGGQAVLGNEWFVGKAPSYVSWTHEVLSFDGTAQRTIDLGLGRWKSLCASGGHLYSLRDEDEERWFLVQTAPDTGDVLQEFTLPPIGSDALEEWFPSLDGSHMCAVGDRLIILAPGAPHGYFVVGT